MQDVRIANSPWIAKESSAAPAGSPIIKVILFSSCYTWIWDPVSGFMLVIGFLSSGRVSRPGL